MTKKRSRNIWDDLEAGLGSGAQFRVLLHLALQPGEAFTKYGLVKATGLRIPAVAEQLERLLELGWVKKREFSPIMYQICLENEVVKAIRDFFLQLSVARLSDRTEGRKDC